MGLIKRPYEISIWNMQPEEEKIAVIGSDQMTSLARAIEPIITRNVNGTITLEFKMYTQFFDSTEGRMVDNPYIPLLVVERVIKLKYKNQWYDLVIKNRVESSDQKMFTYIAKSLHIHELSKNGFDLEFSTELFNNQGTIFYLGDKIVEGTDWTIDKDNSTQLKAFVEDQLIICRIVNSSYNATPLLGGNTFSISPNSYVYTFNSELQKFKAGETKELQIIYIAKTAKKSIDDFDKYIVEKGFHTDEGVITTGVLAKISPPKKNVSKIRVSEFRGKYLANSQKTKYNKVLDRYVGCYEGGKEGVEGYTEIEAIDIDLVQNFMVNSSDFEDTSGWYSKFVSGDGHANIDIDIYPKVLNTKDIEKNKNAVKNSRLKITSTKSGQRIYNTAFRSNATKIKEIKKGDTFILRYRFEHSDSNTISEPIQNTTHFIFTYTYYDKKEEKEKEREIFHTTTSKGSVVKINEKSYRQVNITFNESFSQEEIKNITFEIMPTKTTSLYLDDIQLFRKIKAIPQGELTPRVLEPGEIPAAAAMTRKYFYDVKTNKEKTKPEQYVYLPTGDYTPIFLSSEGYPKITSIEKSQSNRFNLIQDLCEAFECWANFVITHDKKGKITKKQIQFKEYIGEEKYSGFKYGINLKSIKRTIDSEQIVTKTIVKQNSNEHGTNGFCTIARAPDNPSGENFILNFDYYINQGLLDRETLNNDLYENFNKKGSGFYSQLKTLNNEIQTLTNDIANNSVTLTELEANLKVAEQTLENGQKELSTKKSEYKKYTNTTYPKVPETAKNKNEEITDGMVASYLTSILYLEQAVEQATTSREAYQGKINSLKKTIDEKTKDLTLKTNTKKEIINTFFKKYKRFIQEGTWNSEEYYDDNTYYLDALNVSRTSAKPKITYTIDVVDISMLEGYEVYDINVGDKTFIEDVEFFGYVYFGSDKSVMKRPYREEIVVTEIKENLDSPEKNQIKVQNYKTQFDDLFQRITAVTEQLQYATGGYNRASVAFNNDGTMNAAILQNTFLSQSVTIQNPNNTSIIWNEEGIKVVDPKSTNKIVQITGGKIALTEDGGKTFSSAITASGINTNLLTAGQINTDKIFIGNSKDFAFRWDNVGLNAYTTSENGGYNYGKFVRFDKYGIYGYSKGTSFKPDDLETVKKNADFGLTWDGFFLKSTDRSGWIEIDSVNDFRVIENGNERIKIGYIDNSYFGMTIRDSNGNTVFQTDDDGNLSITGNITASGGNIGGWYIGKDGDNTVLSSTKDSSGDPFGIILNASTSSMYSASYVSSLGSAGWSIQENEAIFNNITLRGALKCAVLEYGEVQAVGGIMMIRPSTVMKTAKKDETNNQFICVEVENSSIFTIGDWCKFTSDIDVLTVNDDPYTGINTDLFNLENKNDKYLYFRIEDEEQRRELIEKINNNTMAVISLGKVGTIDAIGSIGLGLNSSTNNGMIPQTSFSVFSLEEKNDDVKYLKPHIILGKIPNGVAYGHLSNKFGLYADSVKITGDSSFGDLYLTQVAELDTNDTKDVLRLYSGSNNNTTLCLIPAGLNFGRVEQDNNKVNDLKVVNGLFKTQTLGGESQYNSDYDKYVYETINLNVADYSDLISTLLMEEKLRKTIYLDFEFKEGYSEANIEKIEITFYHLGREITKSIYPSESNSSLSLPYVFKISEVINTISLSDFGGSMADIITYVMWLLTALQKAQFSLKIYSEKDIIAKYSLQDTELGQLVAGFCENNGKGLLLCQQGIVTDEFIGPTFRSGIKKVGDDSEIFVLSPGNGYCQLGEGVLGGRWKALYVEEIYNNTKITTSSITTSSITTSSITTSSIDDSCFITAYYPGTDSEGKSLITHHLLPKKQEVDENGRHVYYIGKDDNYWTRVYSYYIKTLAFEGAKNNEGTYYTIRPPMKTYEGSSKVENVEGGTTKRLNYNLGSPSYRWDACYVHTPNFSQSYNGSSAGDTSDARKKNSITPLPDKYSTLFDNLNPVAYKYNDGNSNRFHTGFIAQDVEQAIVGSGLTTQDFAAIMHKQGIDEEGNEIDCYYLRYGEFVALNTSEIQKLKKRVAQLEQEIIELKTKINP